MKMVNCMCKDSFVEKHYKNFIYKNGYIPKMFNPYNETEIKDITPTLTANCANVCSSSAVLIVVEEGGD